MSRPITIIGAGLSGLTLGLCLKHKGVAAVIYEKAASSPAQGNYGITLYSSTYQPLLGLLNMDETTFRQHLAIDAEQGGTGKLLRAHTTPRTDAFFCHRGRLEALLGSNQTIHWSKNLKHVQINRSSKEVSAEFEDKRTAISSHLVACDGPHSAVREILSPKMQPEVLPYVAINGKRRMSWADFKETIEQHMQDSVCKQTLNDGALLQVSIANMTESHVDISYTYSRLTKDESDPLHKPNREKSGAKDIPLEFFDELAALNALSSPFKEIFDVNEVKNDRLLHWLMRCLDPNQQEIERLANLGVDIIGDAIHATPILGGEGANMAIKDGLELADFIARNGSITSGFGNTKFEEWRQSVEESKVSIHKMHQVKTSSL